MSDLTKWHRASSYEAFKRQLGFLRYLLFWYWDALDEDVAWPLFEGATDLYGL